MKKENLTFMVVGFAFGILIGYGVFKAVGETPHLNQGMVNTAMAAPSGPMAPTQTGNRPGASGGGGGGAPMMDAIRDLKKRIQADPNDRDAIVQLANMYHEISMCEEAGGFYEQALTLDRQPRELIGLGICKRATGEFEQAVLLLREAHELDPANWQSLFNLAIVAGFDLGQYETAFDAIETMEAMEPTPPRLADLRQALEKAQAGGDDSGSGG